MKACLFLNQCSVLDNTPTIIRCLLFVSLLGPLQLGSCRCEYAATESVRVLALDVEGQGGDMYHLGP